MAATLPPHRSLPTAPLTDFEVKALEGSDPAWQEHKLGQRFQNVVTDVATLKADDALDDAQPSVKDKDLTAPPGSPTNGDRYIVASVATGVWATHEDDIATADDTVQPVGWTFETPSEGWLLEVEDENLFYFFDGASWGLLVSGAVGPAGGDLAGTYPNPTIGANKVLLTAMEKMAVDGFVGNDDGATQDPQHLTVADALAVLGLTEEAGAGAVIYAPIISGVYLGNATIAEIDAFGGEVGGEMVVATDAGTPAAGTSDVLVIGDLSRFDGVQWKKIIDAVGGFVPANTLLRVQNGVENLVAPMTDASDEGRLVLFDGASNTPARISPRLGDQVSISEANGPRNGDVLVCTTAAAPWVWKSALGQHENAAIDEAAGSIVDSDAGAEGTAETTSKTITIPASSLELGERRQYAIGWETLETEGANNVVTRLRVDGNEWGLPATLVTPAAGHVVGMVSMATFVVLGPLGAACRLRDPDTNAEAVVDSTAAIDIEATAEWTGAGNGRVQVDVATQKQLLP